MSPARVCRVHHRVVLGEWMTCPFCAQAARRAAYAEQRRAARLIMTLRNKEHAPQREAPAGRGEASPCGAQDDSHSRESEMSH